MHAQSDVKKKEPTYKKKGEGVANAPAHVSGCGDGGS